MKNTKKAASLFLGSMLLFLGACQQKPKKEKPHEKPLERVEPPEQIISLDESKSLYDNYSRNRAGLIEKFEKERFPEEEFHTARFSSFDYTTIKQYMAYIEQEANLAKVDISTLRFYFANYSNKEKFPDGKKIVHPRQNSLFVVPTIDIDGENYGFYIGADGKAKLIKDAIEANGIGNNSNNTEKSYASFAPNLSMPPSPVYVDKSLAMNRSSSGPPPSTDYQ